MLITLIIDATFFYKGSGFALKLDVNLIENNLYIKICEAFADFFEKKFHRYKSVLEFLRVIETENIVSKTTSEIYKQYLDFCNSTGFEKLDHTVFSKTVCECGFRTYFKVIKENSKRKKLMYFAMR